jgi:transcriptional regulator with XRE-family HTH domain
LRQATPPVFAKLFVSYAKTIEIARLFADATAVAIWHLRCSVDLMTKELPERQPTQLEDQIQSQLNSFGARLRELRLKRGWTLQELACRSSLSKAFLSRLESGGRQASIAAALTLSRIFDVSLASLFESPLATEPCVIVRGANAIEKNMNGLKYVPLSNAGRFFNLQPIKVSVPVSRRGNEHYHHDGEEWIYVLSGALTLSLAGKTYDLTPGDAAHFDSRLPHRLIAKGKKDAEVLLVASPVANSAQVALPAVSERRAISPMRLLNFTPQNETSGFSKSRRAKINFPKTKLKFKSRKDVP